MKLKHVKELNAKDNGVRKDMDYHNYDSKDGVTKGYKTHFRIRCRGELKKTVV